MAVTLESGLLACATGSTRADVRSTIPPLPANASWTSNPALPSGAQMAVLAGKPQEPGLYATRVRFPPNFRVMPHSHPDDRLYTVISGTWKIGLGQRFDPALLDSFPVGAVYLLRAGTSHFHWSSGESVVQITGTGPTATTYVNPADDPRQHAR
jgi:hypothetical protein